MHLRSFRNRRSINFHDDDDDTGADPVEVRGS